MGRLLTARPVPWTLSDCLWASIPAAVLFGSSAMLRLRGSAPSPLLGTGVHPGRLIALFLVTAAVWIVPVWIVMRRRHASAFDLGLVPAPLGKSARLIGIAFLIVFGTSLLWGAFALRFHFSLQPDMLKRFPAGWPGLLLALVLGAIVAPVTEEIFFRGFIFAALRKNYPFAIAASVSALIFAVGHLVPGAIVPLWVLGFLFALLRERTASIWPSIAMHMLNNALYLGARFAEHHLTRG